MSERYDPALRKSASGKRLYSYWKKVRQNPHSSAFETFPRFLRWATDNGYECGDKLVLIDPSKPYSPDNCKWKRIYHDPIADKEAKAKDRAVEWDVVINRVRKQFGLPPLEGTTNE